MIRFRFLITFMITALSLLSSCGRKGLIPRDTMSEIYAEMFVVDQWFRDNQRYTKMTDTLFVYEPILTKYGYSIDEYMRSEDYYMNDTERYSRILKKTRAILERRSEELVKLIQTQEMVENERDYLQRMIDSLSPIRFLALFGDSTKWVPIDSTGMYGVYADTLSNRYDFLELRDTLYSGGELINIQ